MVILNNATDITKFNAIITLVVCLLALPARAGASPTAPSCNAAQTFSNVDEQLKNERYGEARTMLDSLRSCPTLSNIEQFNLGWLYGRSRDFHTALTIFNSLPADVPDPLTHQY